MDEIQLNIDLLKQWKRYLEAGNPPDFGDFGKWLGNKHGNRSAAAENTDPLVKQVGIEPVIGMNLGTLILYVEMWAKLTLEPFSIKSLTDYGILKFIEHNGSPPKKAVVKASLVETSTCLEILKRLAKKGMIDEQPDDLDKRVRRVSLSDQGKKEVRQIDEKVFNLSRLLVGNLDAAEKDHLLTITNTLKAFHEHLHNLQDKEQIKAHYKL